MADFKLGRIKFKWRGNWATSTAYLIDDVIKYGGNTYVCIQNHTSPSNENLFYTNPGTYTSYWPLQSESLFFKGTYAADTWYKLNDLVKYGQRQYRCTTAHTSASTVGGVAILNASNFELYQDGIDFKGNYATSTYYKVNDVVKYGGGQWKCNTAHTSSASAGAFDETKFDEFAEGLQFEDSWSVSTVYQKGDIVTYGGYSYVSKVEHSGQTPNDEDGNTYWDLLNPGFKAQGNFSYGSSYQTGAVIQYGGNSYVALVNNQNEYPATSTGSTNDTYWQLLNEGFNWRATYAAGTTYNIGDVVEYSSSSYVMIVDRS